jgi:hypothetical protein
MAKDPIHRAGSFEAENSGGGLAGLFADEDDFDRRSLLRLASWGVVAVSAVAVALTANQSSIGLRHEQVAVADLARQEQQIQSITKEGQNEARRLASAIDTLNGDRDRLYSRVTVLEQGLESVTGSIARQKATVAAAPPPPAAAAAPPPALAAVASTPAAPPNPGSRPVPAVTASAEKSAEKSVADAGPPRPNPEEGTPKKPATPAAVPPTPLAAKSITATPEPAAKAAATPTPAPTVVAVVPAADKPDAARADAAPSMPPKVEVQKTEFAVDVGGANSVGGLRALWRGLLKSRSNAPLAALHPIIMIKESSTGAGMQLRLGAGPLSDAAAAAKICAVMVENRRPCETTVYDGQRLAMTAEDATPAAKPGSARPAGHRRSYAKRLTVEEAPPPPVEPTTLSTIFGKR